MFCGIDFKSVFKVLSLSTEMQFLTDLALMKTQPQRIKVDDATRTNDNRGISWCPDSCQGKLLNLVSLTNLFEMLYPRLLYMLMSIMLIKRLCFTLNYLPGKIIFLNLSLRIRIYLLHYQFLLKNLWNMFEWSCNWIITIAYHKTER